MFAPRSWALQGSMDGHSSWTDCRRHTKDSTLGGHHRLHYWPIPYPQQKAYAHFRILQTGPVRRSYHPQPNHPPQIRLLPVSAGADVEPAAPCWFAHCSGTLLCSGRLRMVGTC